MCSYFFPAFFFVACVQLPETHGQTFPATNPSFFHQADPIHPSATTPTRSPLLQQNTPRPCCYYQADVTSSHGPLRLHPSRSKQRKTHGLALSLAGGWIRSASSWVRVCSGSSQRRREDQGEVEGVLTAANSRRGTVPWLRYGLESRKLNFC